MLAILAIKFINTGMDRWDGNLDAFYWVNDSDATLGKIMHWLIVIIVAGTCIECGFYVLAQKKPASLLIKNGFSVFSYGILLKFGNTVFDDWAFDDDMSIVLYRIFGTYEEHVKITIYIGLILVGIGFFLLKVVQKANE